MHILDRITGISGLELTESPLKRNKENKLKCFDEVLRTCVSLINIHCLDKLSADITCLLTGISGPGGGTLAAPEFANMTERIFFCTLSPWIQILNS